MYGIFRTVFRLHDIVVHLWLTGLAPYPDPDPALFISDLEDTNNYFLKVHLFHFSKEKSHKKIHKTVEIKAFLTNFAWWWKNLESDPDSGGPKTYGSGSGTLFQTHSTYHLCCTCALQRSVVLLITGYSNIRETHRKGMTGFVFFSDMYFWTVHSYLLTLCFSLSLLFSVALSLYCIPSTLPKSKHEKGQTDTLTPALHPMCCHVCSHLFPLCPFLLFPPSTGPPGGGGGGL